MDIAKRIAALAAAVIMSLGCTAAYAQESAEVYREYYAGKTVSTPKANEKSGVYDENLYIELSCSTRGAKIFYTTDGTEPDIYSKEYEGDPIRIKCSAGETVSVTIRAVAVKTGYENSNIAEFEYTVEIPAELDVRYMEIDTEPRKLRYGKGEALDLTGGYIVVTYEDWSHKDIAMTESMISGFNTNTAGEKELTVTYAGFIDTFTIDVKFSGGSSSDIQTESPYSGISESAAADNAVIAGTDTKGWSAIASALRKKSAGTSVSIETNGSVSVPAAVILAAIEKNLTLEFTVEDNAVWSIRTTDITDGAVPPVGLGFRTDGVYIPDVLTSGVGGAAAAFIHFNGDNKLCAEFSYTVDQKYSGQFASLYCYDESTETLVLADTCKIAKDGGVKLCPQQRGDYVIIADSVTKIKGDLNNSMTVTAADASLLLKLIVNGGTDDPRADFNGDGKVNVADASAILKSVVGYKG